MTYTHGTSLFIRPTLQHMIHLNVGGQLFCTLKQTLRSAGGLLGAIADNSQQFLRDDKGVIFIDRNPKYFDQILDLARNNGRPIRQKLPPELLDEADYFGITSEIPFRFKAGDWVDVYIGSSSRRALVQEITLHAVTISLGAPVVCSHDVWNGTNWTLQHNVEIS